MELLEAAVAAAIATGRFLKGAKTGAKLVQSSRRDLKLNVDQQAESMAISLLPTDFPVLGEEAGWQGRRSDSYWVVDGLDGTVNFHYGIPISAVSIGLVQDGEPVLGVVYDFLHDEVFAGGRGTGVTANGVPVKVSDADSPASALMLTALATSADFEDQALAQFGLRLGLWRKVRMLGSAALSLAYVASGRADVCEISGIMEWDVAAGVALVRAGGGTAEITPRGGHVVDVVASNGLLGGVGKHKPQS